MKTDKQLSQEIMQKIQAEKPKRARAKKRARVGITALCAFLLLLPSAFLLKENEHRKTTPEPTSESSSLEEMDEPTEED